MSLSPAVIDAMVANGATVEMMAAVMKAELAEIAKQQAEAEAATLARRANAAEKKRRQRGVDVPRFPNVSPGRPAMSLDVLGTDRDMQGQEGTLPKTKVSPTPPSKTQTLVIPPIVPQKMDGSLRADGDAEAAERPTASTGRRADLTVQIAGDVEFGELWDIATQPMRRRAKSQAKTYPAWVAAKRRQPASRIVSALRRYVTEDEDVKRGMGQPGLQRWLADQAYDQWLATSDSIPGISDERWRMMVEFFREGTPWPADHGPEPGQLGCRAPPEILTEFNFLASHRSAA